MMRSIIIAVAAIAFTIPALAQGKIEGTQAERDREVSTSDNEAVITEAQPGVADGVPDGTAPECLPNQECAVETTMNAVDNEFAPDSNKEVIAPPALGANDGVPEGTTPGPITIDN